MFEKYSTYFDVEEILHKSVQIQLFFFMKKSFLCRLKRSPACCETNCEQTGRPTNTNPDPSSPHFTRDSGDPNSSLPPPPPDGHRDTTRTSAAAAEGARGNEEAAAAPAARRAMAELRHATAALAAATRATSSPSKRDAEAASASSPLVASPRVSGGGGGKDGVRPHQRWSLPPPVRSLLALEDPRSPAASASYRILVAAMACFALAALFSAPSVWARLVSSWFPDRLASSHIRSVSLDL